MSDTDLAVARRALIFVLLAWLPVLSALKRQGLGRYGALVSQHNLAFEAKWIDGGNADAADGPLASPDISSLADLAAGFELVRSMRPVPVTRASIVPLIGAALLPLAGVALTQVPFRATIDSVKGLLVL